MMNHHHPFNIIAITLKFNEDWAQVQKAIKDICGFGALSKFGKSLSCQILTFFIMFVVAIILIILINVINVIPNLIDIVDAIIIIFVR